MERVPEEWDRELVGALVSAPPGQDRPTRVMEDTAIPVAPAGVLPPGAEAADVPGVEVEAGVSLVEAGVGLARAMARDGEVTIPAGNMGTAQVTAPTHTGD